MGGLYFVMEYAGGTWTNNGFGDRGWLAIALVIFALWLPKKCHLGIYSFWWSVYSLSVYSGAAAQYTGNLQNAALCGDDYCVDFD